MNIYFYYFIYNKQRSMKLYIFTSRAFSVQTEKESMANIELGFHPTPFYQHHIPRPRIHDSEWNNFSNSRIKSAMNSDFCQFY